MGRGAVFPQEDALPRAQLHPATSHGDDFTGAGQSHFNVTGHIIGAFQRVPKIRIIFRHEPIQPTLEIPTSCRIGIFHDHQAATRVLAKNGHHPSRDSTRRHNICDLPGHFERAGASG